MTESDSADENEGRVVRCDLCGEEALSVRRIALDGDYDRLRKPHEVHYACPREEVRRNTLAASPSDQLRRKLCIPTGGSQVFSTTPWAFVR